MSPRPDGRPNHRRSPSRRLFGNVLNLALGGATLLLALAIQSHLHTVAPALKPLSGEVILAPDRLAPDRQTPSQTPSSQSAPAGDGTNLWSQPPVGTAVTHYQLNARLEPETHRVLGSGTVRWRNASNKAQNSLYLHLYLNAFASEKSVFMRADVGGGFRGGGMPEERGSIEVQRLYARELKQELWPDKPPHSPDDPDDATDIRIALPRPVVPGETLTLELKWTAQLPRLTHRTGFKDSFHMVAQWFPKLARLEPDGRWAHFPFHRLGEFYADFGDYDVTIEAPRNFIVGASGVAQPARDIAGNNRQQRFTAQRVHDFAFTAWDGFGERLDEHAGVELRCLFPKGDDDLARYQLGYVKRALDHYGQRYGRYPYPNLTVMHPPSDAVNAGGMEYPTLITTGGSWAATRLGFRFLENVTVHELGHQWFYGLVASNEHAWPFLDEGLTSYAQNNVMEAIHPQASGAQLLGLSISNLAVMRTLAGPSAHHAPVAQPVTAFANGQDYGALVYQRTTLLLESLGRAYGKEQLERALLAYAQKFRFGHPAPEDLLRAVQEHLGDEAAGNLRRGLFERGWLDYQLADVKQLEPKGTTYRASILLRRLGTLDMPVDVLLIDEKGAQQVIHHRGTANHTHLPYRGEAPLAAVLIDPQRALLIDEDLRNNSWRSDGRQSARRVVAHTSYGWQLLAAGLAP